MILTKTPYRISFFGGGTDFPEFFEQFGGAVLGSAIDQYIYHTILPFKSSLFDYNIRIAYRQVECVVGINDIQHAPFREVLRYLGVEKDIEISLTSDLPSFSGLGSSSSFVVGLINAVLAYQRKSIPKLEIAKIAIDIERNVLKEPVGCQDQVFAAVGGFNVIEFRGQENIIVNRIPISASRIAELESSILIFYTGIKRKAGDLEAKKIQNLAKIQESLKSMYSIVDRGYRILTGNETLSSFGELLHDNWLLKKSLEAGVSNSTIDQMYELGMEAGALGGKLLGAGGGGFLLFFVPPDRQSKVRNRLSGYPEIKVRLDAPGTQVVHC